MGRSVLPTLLWKNFIWCKRHPIKTAIFFILPIIFLLFLFLIHSLKSITNNRNCDYESVAVWPSHSTLVVQSLVCNDWHRCREGGRFMKSEEHFNWFTNITNGNVTSYLCPFEDGGGGRKDFGGEFDKSIDDGCKNKKAKRYRDLAETEIIIGGQLLYFPMDANTDQIVQNMAKKLDQLGNAKIGLVLAPYLNDNPHLTNLFELATAVSCYVPLSERTKGFASRSEAFDHARSLNLNDNFTWAIVHFIDVNADHMKYKIVSHYRQRTSLSTLHMQSLLESTLIEWKTGKTLNTLVEINTLPLRCHKDKSVYDIYYMVLAIVLCIGLIPICHAIAGEICYEKSVGLIEFLYISGVSKMSIKLSWYIFGVMFMQLVMTMIAIITWFVDGRLFENTSFVVFLLLLYVYGFALVALCFTVASISSTAQRASLIMLLLLIVAYLLPGWAQFAPEVGYTSYGRLLGAQLMALLHPSIAVQIGLAYMFEMEKVSRGYDLQNLGTTPVKDDKFISVTEVFIYLGVQSVVYMALSFYFDNVAPSKYGLKRPWYYPVMWPWLMFGKPVSKEERHNEVEPNLADIEPGSKTSDGKTGICIKQLTKTYGSGESAFNAVDNLSVFFPKRSITVLLGHNGAGKSTTMNILTGMTTPTKGTAIIDGRPITEDMDDIRKDLSFCPQYDIVYRDLSVIEHLHFYGKLKGIARSEVDSYAEKMLHMMQMDSKDQMNTRADDLSGGMKRKLSICIAFLGHPGTVILDEPTSAIDPFSRRAIWDVVLDFKATSTILISTHYMQEADILGDNIAIINHGRLQCVGSPMYLKGKYGSGSYLQLAHKTQIDTSKIQHTLGEVVHLELVAQSGSETKFALPNDVTAGTMSDMMAILEENKAEWEIESFGITGSTMEQVFFAVASDGPKMGASKSEADLQSHRSVTVKNTHMTRVDPVVGCSLMMMQWWAMWVKRLHITRKSKLGLVFQVVMPLVFIVFLLMLINLTKDMITSDDTHLMHIWNTSMETNRLFSAGKVQTSIDQYQTSMIDDGLGIRCMAGAQIGGLTCEAQSSPTSLPASSSLTNITVACDCHLCPENAADPTPTEITLRSGDMLWNLGARNVTEYLLKSNVTMLIGGFESLVASTYSSLVMDSAILNISANVAKDVIDGKLTEFTNILSSMNLESLGITTYNPKSLTSVQALITAAMKATYSGKGTGTGTIHKIWTGVKPKDERGGGNPTEQQNDQEYMKMAMSNVYSNAIYRTMAATDPSTTGISAYFEETALTDEASASEVVSGLLLAMFASFALLMPIVNILLFIVTEATSGNRQLQFVMGLSKMVYWLANFTWDILLFLLSVLLVVAFMLLFPDSFDIDYTVFILAAFVFGVGMILLGYWMTFLVSSAQAAVVIVSSVCPILTFAAIILQLAFLYESWYEDVNNMLLLLPPYFISSVILEAVRLQAKPNFTGALLDFDNLGKRYVTGLIFCVIMVILILLWSLNIPQRLGDSCCAVVKCRVCINRKIRDDDEQNNVEDNDVKAEARDILSGGSHGTNNSDRVFVVKELTKRYDRGNKLAVRGITFGVSKGECFGLLGINGAGKSTTFKMLTGYERPTSGDALIDGKSVFTSQSSISHKMSYCPQTDVLFESLTAHEHLEQYARIRGIPSEERRVMVETLIEETGLTAHTKKNSHMLSGGNKRKLNFCIAMINLPQVVFLDEMTTGMDPAARSATWKVLQKAISLGTSAVITSHSMEECEALCDRLVIMVNGQFKCIGGVQYLKDRFGNNYNVKLRVPPTTDIQALSHRFTSDMTQARLIEKHVGYVEFELPASRLRLSNLYALIDNLEHEFGVSEYSLSQTTLEHVFVGMAKEQE